MVLAESSYTFVMVVPGKLPCVGRPELSHAVYVVLDDTPKTVVEVDVSRRCES